MVCVGLSSASFALYASAAVDMTIPGLVTVRSCTYTSGGDAEGGGVNGPSGSRSSGRTSRDVDNGGSELEKEGLVSGAERGSRGVGDAGRGTWVGSGDGTRVS